MDKVLSVQGLSKVYEGDVPAVNDVSFDLYEGEIVAIYGESGCGKSTLLKMISGFLEPEAGRVYINDKELPYPSEILMPGDPNIEIVKQDYDLFPNHRIEEVLDFKLRKYPDEYVTSRIEELLNACGLQEYRSRVVKLLSGGQQQRVAIAQAIANEPDVVLMDEPFNSLDRTRRRELRALMKSIVKQYHLSIVLVTHDAEDLFSLADRVVVMKDGKVLQQGAPNDLYLKPTNEYVAKLMGELSFVEGIGYRPEDILLKDDTDGHYSIVEEEFLGGYYRYELTANESNVFVYDTQKRSLNQNYSLSFNERNKVVLQS